MSVTDLATGVPTPALDDVAPDGAASFKDRLAQRRKAIREEKKFVLPVLGYGGLLAARYKTITYEEMRAIGRRIDDPESTEGEIAVAADTLNYACVELLEKPDSEAGEDAYVSIASGWSTQIAREWFGVDLPEAATVRDALREIFPSTLLMLHFQDYGAEVDKALLAVEKRVEGESTPSAEGSSN